MSTQANTLYFNLWKVGEEKTEQQLFVKKYFNAPLIKGPTH